MVDLYAQTTLVALVNPSTLTTTAPEALGSVVDATPFVGRPLVAFMSAGTTGTGGKVTVKAQQADLSLWSSSLGSDSADIGLRSGATAGVTVATTFTADSDGTIKNCWLRLKRVGAVAGSKYIKLGIMTDNSSEPSGTLIDIATTVDPSTIATTYSWINFPFATLPDLASGSAYWFVLNGDYDPSGTVLIKQAAETATAGGTLMLYSDSWEAQVTTALPVFRAEGYAWTTSGLTTMAVGTATVTRIPLDLDFGGSAVRGVAKVTAGDGSTSFRVAGFMVAQAQQG